MEKGKVETTRANSGCCRIVLSEGAKKWNPPGLSIRDVRRILEILLSEETQVRDPLNDRPLWKHQFYPGKMPESVAMTTGGGLILNKLKRLVLPDPEHLSTEGPLGTKRMLETTADGDHAETASSEAGMGADRRGRAELLEEGRQAKKTCWWADSC